MILFEDVKGIRNSVHHQRNQAKSVGSQRRVYQLIFNKTIIIWLEENTVQDLALRNLSLGLMNK